MKFVIAIFFALVLSSCGGRVDTQATSSTDRLPTKTLLASAPQYNPDSLYQFFVVAFNAAPGVTYMNQLIEAANSGMSVKEVVNVFTTKYQFTNVYPLSLTNTEFATQLVANVVGNSATAQAKQNAVNDIVSALALPGWTRGDVIYAIFSNLAAKHPADYEWGGTSRQMANQLVYAKYYTEVLKGDTTVLYTLQRVLNGVTQNTDPYNGMEMAIMASLATANLPPMVDSLGREIAENEFGGGDGGAAGGDGSAGDGAPIANAPVLLTDNAGHTATATTDALGYYRINIKGFTPPFVIKVTRSDGTEWYAHSTAQVKTRGFVTMNITGLTDKVGGYVAQANNIEGGAEKVTPKMLAANPSALDASKAKLNTGLTSPLTYVGLDPAKFDPVESRYEAVKTDTYDRLLERVIVSKDKAKGNTTVVGTFAGVKESLVDGPSTVASFDEMRGVAVDNSGNVYVADSRNNVIRKITPAGMVSTLAGSGSYGFKDGAGTEASFRSPWSVAVDHSGNIYVADTGNYAIRKITPAGVVSTLAGSGSQGFRDGTGAAADFGYPQGVAVDGRGNVFVADSLLLHAIRKITPAGVVSTFAGSGSSGFADGTGTAARFNSPSGVAIDGGGNLLVADTNNHAIRKITPAGVVSTLVKGSVSLDANGFLTRAAGVNFPEGVAVDNGGNVYVACGSNFHEIRKVTPDGVDSIFAGSESYAMSGFVDGAGTAARFSFPRGVAVDGSGDVYVADSYNHAIRKITSAGVVSTLAGGKTSGLTDGVGTAARFNGPSGVAVDGGGNVVVADTYNEAIRTITPTGVVSTMMTSGSPDFTGGTGILRTSSVAVDGGGNLYLADSYHHVIRKISPTGVVSNLAGSGSVGFSDGSGTAARFSGPYGVAVDSGGNVYVSDTGNHAIRKITPTGRVSTLAGGITSGFTDGTGAAARFSFPSGLAVDGVGNVYIADGNHAIRKISPTGGVSTLAGSGSQGFKNGTGTAASFWSPTGVAVDGGGNVYVADTNNNVIRKITPAGVVSTLAGDGAQGYSNTAKTAARFYLPYGVAVDSRGNVFVADTLNNAIRIILP